MASPLEHLPVPPSVPYDKAVGPSSSNGPAEAPSRAKSSASKPRKRFVGKSTVPTPSTSQSTSRGLPHPSIPPEILQDKLLNESIAQNLPKNYEFEVHKTIWNIKKWDCKMVGLQMPEGLLMWACVLADIIERFTSAQTVILGDVTYGACCIDDYTALALGCDLLVHYGHSCLVPVDTTTIRTLYVFVEISIDSEHLSKTIRRNFPSDRERFLRELVGTVGEDEARRSAVPIGTFIGGRKRIEGSHQAEMQVQLEETLVSTIQFAAALNRLKEDLSAPLVEDITNSANVVTDKTPKDSGEGIISRVAPDSLLDTGKYETTVPRSKPLSPGEILGCTAPRLKDVDAILYLADGRFHLEAIMIANPSVPAFRYDPYSKKLTREWYDHEEMRTARGNAITAAKATLPPLRKGLAAGPEGSTTARPVSTSTEPRVWGVILGTLGRQGSLLQMEALLRQLETYNTPSSKPFGVPYMPILLSELSPAKLALFNARATSLSQPCSGEHISAFIQTSCPRLSIDWGYAFEKPLLSPYEAAVVLGRAKGWEEQEGDGVGIEGRYPMDFYEAGSVWAVSRLKGADAPWPTF